jgi:DNA invertase Pin-like site-specific DNA recombinase
MARYDEWKKNQWKVKGVEPNVLVYMRVSQDVQDAERQKDMLDKEIVKYNLNVVETLIDNVGHNARWKFQRKNMDRLLEWLDSGQIDIIYVDSFDRIGCGDAWTEIKARIAKASGQNGRVELFDVESGWLTQNDLEPLLAMKASQALREITDKSRRVFTKMDGMSKEGRAIGGCVSYACDVEVRFGSEVMYRLRTIGKRQIKVIYPEGKGESLVRTHNPPMEKGWHAYRVLTSDPKRIEALQWLFNRFDSANITYPGLADEWNHMGWPSTGSVVNALWIRRLLEDSSVIGLPVIGKHSGDTFSRRLDGEFTVKHIWGSKKYFKQDESDWLIPDKPLWDAIIPVPLFKRVQAKKKVIKENWRRKYNKDEIKPGQPRTAKTALYGLVYHGNCTQPMRIHRNYLSCSQPAETTLKRLGCASCSVPVEALEKLLDKYLCDAHLTFEEATGNQKIVLDKKLMDKVVAYSRTAYELHENIVEIEGAVLKGLAMQAMERNHLKVSGRVFANFTKDNPLDKLPPVDPACLSGDGQKVFKALRKGMNDSSLDWHEVVSDVLDTPDDPVGKSKRVADEIQTVFNGYEEMIHRETLKCIAPHQKHQDVPLESYIVDNVEAMTQDTVESVINSIEYLELHPRTAQCKVVKKDEVKVKVKDLFNQFYTKNLPKFQTDLDTVRAKRENIEKAIASYAEAGSFEMMSVLDKSLKEVLAEEQGLKLLMVNKLEKHESLFGRLVQLRDDIVKAREGLADTDKLAWRAFLEKYIAKIVVEETGEGKVDRRITIIPKGTNPMPTTVYEREYSLVRAGMLSESRLKRPMRVYSDDELVEIAKKAVAFSQAHYEAKMVAKARRLGREVRQNKRKEWTREALIAKGRSVVASKREYKAKHKSGGKAR